MSYSKYPQNIDDISTLPIAIDNITPVKAEVVNRLRDGELAIESTLGVAPQGTYGTVRARLDALETLIGETGGGGGGTGSGHIMSWGSVHMTSSSASLNSGFNIGSITRVSEGLVDVEFFTPATRSYAVVGGSDFDNGSIYTVNKTANGFTIQRADINGFALDDDFSFSVLSESALPPPPTPQANPSQIGAWAYVHLTGSSAVLVSGFNIASVQRTALGTVKLVFSNVVSSAYAVVGSANITSGEITTLSQANSNFTVQRLNASGSPTDSDFAVIITTEGVIIPYIHPSAIAQAWGYINLTSGGASISSSYNVISATRTDVGTVSIVLGTTPSSNPYVITFSPSVVAGSCVDLSQSGNTFVVERGNSAGVAVDAAFSFVIYSNG